LKISWIRRVDLENQEAIAPLRRKEEQGMVKDITITPKENPIGENTTQVHLLLIQMDLGGHPPFSMNHHFEFVILINHDIHPFYGEWNVMSSSFVNYRHHVMIS
jgi:hypothetical protein